MGTRNLTCVVVDGEMKVAQYGQWDGYPSGNGVIIKEFLENTNLETFRNKVRGCNYITDEEWSEKFQELFPGNTGGWLNMDEAGKLYEHYPAMGRDTGAEILRMISESENGVVLQDSSDFAGDSLFCEWAYVIDLDQEVLEVYKGFNKEPLNEEDRFYNMEIDETGQGYRQIKLLAKMTFEALADMSNEYFCQLLDPEEVEE